MALTVEGIADLVNAVQKTYKKLSWADISYDYQRHVAAPKLLDEKKVGYDGGSGPTWTMKVAREGSARFVGAFEKDAINVGTLTKQVSVPWRFLTANCAWDLKEIAVLRGAQQIFDLIKMRTIGMNGDIATLLEDAFWSKPASSADEVTPYGIDYWLVHNATDGFTGGAADGFPLGPASLDPATYPGHKNYAFSATEVSRDDFVAGLKKAAYKTDFIPPVPHPEVSPGEDDFGYYTVYEATALMEKIMEAANDNLGYDMAFRDGSVVFRSRPIVPVPALEGKGWCPVYGINWRDFRPMFLNGMDMVRSAAKPVDGQHTVVAQHTDSSIQFCMYERRRHFVGKITSITNT